MTVISTSQIKNEMKLTGEIRVFADWIRN